MNIEDYGWRMSYWQNPRKYDKPIPLGMKLKTVFANSIGVIDIYHHGEYLGYVTKFVRNGKLKGYIVSKQTVDLTPEWDTYKSFTITFQDILKSFK